MSLKTLKELEIGAHIGDVKKIINEKRELGSDWTNSIVLAGDLKQEAIKWIKEINLGHGCEGCPVDKVPSGTFSKYGGCPAGDPNGCGATWILMLFFNITEEDLK